MEIEISILDKNENCFFHYAYCDNLSEAIEKLTRLKEEEEKEEC